MPMTTSERRRLEAIETLHPADANGVRRHPPFAALDHTHTEPVLPVPSGVIFEDDFSGTAIDTSKWSPLYQVGDPGFGLDSDFLGNLSQVSVGNGTCKITAQRAATPSGRPYRSACMSTKGKFSFLYGTVETRFRWPAGQAMFPAFWALRQQAAITTPPEVDMMEAYPGTPGAGGGSGPNVMVVSNHAVGGITYFAYDHGSNMTGVFHVLKWIWAPGSMKIHLNGIQIGQLTSEVPSDPMYLIYNLAVGAPGYRVDGGGMTSPSTAAMEIDYIRVWK